MLRRIFLKGGGRHSVFMGIGSFYTLNRLPTVFRMLMKKELPKPKNGSEKWKTAHLELIAKHFKDNPVAAAFAVMLYHTEIRAGEGKLATPDQIFERALKEPAIANQLKRQVIAIPQEIVDGEIEAGGLKDQSIRQLYAFMNQAAAIMKMTQGLYFEDLFYLPVLLDPEDPSNWSALARALWQKQEFTQAKEVIVVALSMMEDPELRGMLGQFN